MTATTHLPSETASPDTTGAPRTPGAKVVVIGAGAMGLPMALRLQGHGAEVTAIDVSERRVAECRDLGLAAGTDLDLAAGADLVVAMVATGQQLLDLVTAPVVTEGRLRGAVLVVASTVGPDVVRQAATAAAAHGVRLLDCPVTGGVAGAEAGTLTLFAAGEPEVVAAAAAALAPTGTVRVVGSRPGDGQSLKLVNQMLASIHLAAAGEAIAFAERLGLDLDVVQEVLPTGAAGSWMLADRGPRMAVSAASRPTQTQLSVFVKDSGLVADAAAAAGAHAPLTAAARTAWLRAADLGLDDGDDSGVVDVFRDR